VCGGARHPLVFSGLYNVISLKMEKHFIVIIAVETSNPTNIF
jgi:hypothetical protein